MLDYHRHECAISPFFLPHLEATNPKRNSLGLQVGISAIARPGGTWVEVAIVVGGAILPGGPNSVGAALINPYDYGYSNHPDMDMWGGDEVLRMSWEDYGKAMAYLTDPKHNAYKHGHSAICHVANVLNHYPAQRALAEECEAENAGN